MHYLHESHYYCLSEFKLAFSPWCSSISQRWATEISKDLQSREATALAANEELIMDVQLIKVNMILLETYRSTVEFLCNRPTHSFEWKKSTPVNMYGTETLRSMELLHAWMPFGSEFRLCFAVGSCLTEAARCNHMSAALRRQAWHSGRGS